MKKYIAFTVSLFISFLAFAQENDIEKAAQKIADAKIDTLEKWHTGGLIGLNFSQAGFSNWAAGGQNSLCVTSLVSLHANYRNGKFSWLNDAELGYGEQKTGDDLFQKTTDQLELTSSVGYKLYDHTSLSFLTNFQTQFQPGYSNAGDSTMISNFMAPAFWVLALGLQYNSNLNGITVFVSPLAARLTFVENQTLSDEGAFGVDSGKTELTQLGAYIKVNYAKEIMKNVKLNTCLELFSNYLKDPQNIVVNWSAFLLLKVNKWLSATVNTQVIYDNNVLIPIYKDNVLVGKGPRLQFKDVIGVGLAVNLK